MPVATPIAAGAEQLSAVTYNADGLVPAIVQEHGTRRSADDGLDERGDPARDPRRPGVPSSGPAAARQRWRKGDTSGDRQWVRAAYYDCDGDTLLFVVEQEGAGACHTGEPQLLPPPLRGGCTAEELAGVTQRPSRERASPSWPRTTRWCPVWRELLADLTTPVAAFARLAG